MKIRILTGILILTVLFIPAHAEDTVLVLAGLGNQTYFPAEALPKTLNLTFQYSYMLKAQAGDVLVPPFPRNMDGLKSIGVIVMADVPVSALNGLMGSRTLRRFVEEGGGLLVFGGPFSLGKGNIAGSAVEPVLPVTVTGPWDLVKTVLPVVKIAKASPLTDGLPWKEKPVLCYHQKVMPAAGSETLLECDGYPALVTGRYGKGRVAVFAGTYLGEPSAASIFFYNWSGYPELLSRVMRWLLNG